MLDTVIFNIIPGPLWEQNVTASVVLPLSLGKPSVATSINTDGINRLHSWDAYKNNDYMSGNACALI